MRQPVITSQQQLSLALLKAYDIEHKRHTHGISGWVNTILVVEQPPPLLLPKASILFTSHSRCVSIKCFRASMIWSSEHFVAVPQVGRSAYQHTPPKQSSTSIYLSRSTLGILIAYHLLTVNDHAPQSVRTRTIPISGWARCSATYTCLLACKK